VFDDVISSFPDPEGASFIELVLFYAINNITASLLFIVSGLVLGVPPLLFIAFNGFFIGWSVYTYAKEVGFWLVTALLLPHGIIEIPTIILSAAMGMGLGYQLIHQIRKKGSIRDYLVESFYIFMKRIVPLLIIAAIIETVLSVLVLG
jgi:stage II sporulation protein M